LAGLTLKYWGESSGITEVIAMILGFILKISELQHIIDVLLQE
jgi:hypothetical protein